MRQLKEGFPQQLCSRTRITSITSDLIAWREQQRNDNNSDMALAIVRAPTTPNVAVKRDIIRVTGL